MPRGVRARLNCNWAAIVEHGDTQAITLRDLLIEIKNGYAIVSPVLIRVHRDGAEYDETTTERTITTSTELDWTEEYTREYASEEFTFVGSNSLVGGLDQVVSIGRSRSCAVRVENESVSKLHASIVFDRSSGGYFVTDEGSRNGTCLNGESLIPKIRAALWSGAYLSFGDAVFVFIDPPTLRKLSRFTKAG